ncbi:unnamed protein product [Menidia menidia]|uniref:(Atlantic silverside) hypothetical protein n=1 Tax=Menidia menidia TaxID=238744 RepID=A0A8S4BIX9_9TELE|nr:unnamed protein product [Menidia menidia]
MTRTRTECVCVHGVCDNRPGSGGVCLRGSCLDGFSGELCDRRAVPCGADGRLQHCHLQADCSTSGLSATRGGCHGNAECVFVGPGNASCVCAEGWTGDGRACAEINNCQQESRGGCSPNADCQHLGPAQAKCELREGGVHTCTCPDGYAGDGTTCYGSLLEILEWTPLVGIMSLIEDGSTQKSV